jgi:hypothetical protein
MEAAVASLHHLGALERKKVVRIPHFLMDFLTLAGPGEVGREEKSNL